jgi:hypothetical protein
MAQNFGRFGTYPLVAEDLRTLQAYQQLPRNLANNQAVHPLFGTIVTNNQGVLLPLTPQGLEASYQEYVPRELSITKEIVHNNRLLDGLANPAGYLFRKNQDLENIGKELGIEYGRSLAKYTNDGYSIEEAREHSLKEAQEIKHIRMREHERSFPTEITKEAMGRYERKNRTAN